MTRKSAAGKCNRCGLMSHYPLADVRIGEGHPATCPICGGLFLALVLKSPRRSAYRNLRGTGATPLCAVLAPSPTFLRTMDREIAKIIERLEEMKARADELGQERQNFVANIKAAEDLLEVARKEVEEVKRQKGIIP